MTFPRARLTVAACLFVAWLGYLLTLVVLSWHEIVLSRPQFLVAPLCVIAELSDNDGAVADEITVKQVSWSQDKTDEKLVGKKIKVLNLPDAGIQGRYRGPGNYILPLHLLLLDKAGDATYIVLPVPSSPRFEPAFVHVNVYPGPDHDVVARIASDYLGVDLAEARDILKNLGKLKPAVLKKNVAWEQAVSFRRHLMDAEARTAKKDAMSEVYLQGNDVRIYPLTPETREQLDELIAAREK